MAKAIVLYSLAGIVLGTLMNVLLTPDSVNALVPYLHLVPQIFLRLIKSIVAPLVLTMLMIGIADHGDSKEVGRVGVKAMLMFLAWSLVALTVGMIGADTLQPGADLHLTSGLATASMAVEPFSASKLMEEIVPQSLAESWASNAILQIVCYSILCGLALSGCLQHARRAVRQAQEALAGAPPERVPHLQGVLRHARREGAYARLFLGVLKGGKAITFRLVGYVMLLAPLAALFSLAAVVATNGPTVLTSYGRFVVAFFVSLSTLWGFFYAVGWVFIGRRPVTALVSVVKEAALIAFSTASSEAAFPKLLEELDHFGVPAEVSGLVLPLGYSFNLDGSMMYCSFATLFIAQAYGIHLPVGQQIIMLLTLMLTSKGMAAVPKASLVVITSALTQFHIPEAGLALILAVDQILDMCRSATNVMGNALTCVLVAHSEGVFSRRKHVAPPLPAVVVADAALEVASGV